MSEQSEKEAKEIIERKSSIPLNGESFEAISNAYDLAAFALQQRIGEIPVFSQETQTFACPYCGSENFLLNKAGNQNRFCGYCGKKINWKDIPTDKVEGTKSLEALLIDLGKEHPELSTAAYNCIMRSYNRLKAESAPLLHEAYISDFLKAVKPFDFFQTRGVGRKIYKEVANYLNLNFKANWPGNMIYK